MFASSCAQVCQLRETLADLQEQDYDFSDAAKTLIGIPLESGHRCIAVDLCFVKV